MALLNTTKLVYGALGIGAIGGSSAGLYYYLNDSDSKGAIKSKNIKQKLEEVGYLVLTNQDADWEAVLVEYNKVQQATGIFPGSTLKGESKEGLKAKCALATVAEDDTNYQLAKKWCVKIETIDQMLTRKGYTKLGAVGVAGMKDKWNKKVVAIKAMPANQRNIEVDFKNTDGDGALLEAKCKLLNVETTKTYSHNDFESHYKQVRDWCSTKNS